MLELMRRLFSNPCGQAAGIPKLQGRLALIVIMLFSVNSLIAAPLISLDSKEGTKLFYRFDQAPYFWRLNSEFISQKNLTFCSIASSVMVLNALKVTAPHDPAYGKYSMFTQENFFTDPVKKILSIDQVTQKGSTLDQISEALRTFGVTVKTFHANKSSLKKFRKLVKNTINKQQGYIIVNYLRTGVGQEGGGHMSPIAGYDPKTDRILLLDVARYRYPPVWVQTQDLWNAMNTQDSDSKAFRGYVLVTY